MVIRSRLQSFLQQLAVYVVAAGMIAYFGFHAFNGAHGLEASNQYERQRLELSAQLVGLQAERAVLERRVALLQSSALDPDMLDERARDVLGVVNPADVVILVPHAARAP